MKPPITVTLKLDQRTLPAQVFERYARREDSRKIRAIRAELAWENFGKPGRDPVKLGGVATVIAKNGNWMPYLKISQLYNHLPLPVFYSCATCCCPTFTAST